MAKRLMSTEYQFSVEPSSWTPESDCPPSLTPDSDWPSSPTPSVKELLQSMKELQFPAKSSSPTPSESEWLQSPRNPISWMPTKPGWLPDSTDLGWLPDSTEPGWLPDSTEPLSYLPGWPSRIEPSPSNWIPSESDWVRFLEDLSSTTPPEPKWLRLGENLERNRYFFVITYHSRTFIQHCVFLIDINAESNILKYPVPTLDPVVRFGMGHEAFSIIGTTLYMFAGREYEGKRQFWSKKMSIYDMSTALLSGTTITLWEGLLWSKMDTLQHGPEMTAGKRWPISVVIGSFKVCVFSSTLYLNSADVTGYPGPFGGSYLGPNFEVYDTRKGSWVVLPEPCEYDKVDPQVTVAVNSYCVNHSSFIIQTELGIYGINVDNTNPKWVKMDQSESIKKFPVQEMWTMVDKQFFNPYRVVQREDLTSCPFAVKDPTDNGWIFVRGGLRLTDHPGYKCAPPNLLVDILKFDAGVLTKLGSDSCEVLEIQSDRSFNFALTSTSSVDMTVIACFPLKGMDTSLDASKDYIWQKIKDGLQWLDIADKVTSESGEQSLYFSNSPIKGATGHNS